MIIDKSNVVVGEEVILNVEVQDASIAALTLWIYFDDEKLDYVSNFSNDSGKMNSTDIANNADNQNGTGDYNNNTNTINNVNVVGNRVIYTWYSETGKNQRLSNILQVKFKVYN